MAAIAVLVVAFVIGGPYIFITSLMDVVQLTAPISYVVIVTLVVFVVRKGGEAHERRNNS